MFTDFQELHGDRMYADDHAIVRINGKKVFDRAGLTTRTTVDRASAFDHDLADGRARVEIELPKRRLTAGVEVEARGQKSIVVNVAGGDIRTEVVEGVVGDA